MTKLFKEMTIAEKFMAIAKELENAEMVAFLQERAEKQTKANATPRKASAQSVGLQGAITEVLSDGVRRMADDVLAELEAKGYTDDHKAGLTIARVRAGLSALAKEGLITKFDAERKKDSAFPKVSYQAEIVEVETEENEGE